MVWAPLGLAAATFLVITLTGNVLVIGAKLGTLYPALETGFYGVLACLFVWLVAMPLFQVLSAPVVALAEFTDPSSKTDHNTLKKVARQLVRSRALPPEHHSKLVGALGIGSALQQPLAAAITAQTETATKIIRDHAVLVFVSTSVSQNGRLDAITVLAANFRLVRALVSHFGYRPPLPSLLKIYAQIFIAALIADEVDDLDVEGVTAQMGLGVLTAVPGSALIINSLLDGTINALLTLRVGFVARRCLLNAGNPLTRRELRKTAIRESRQELKAVWKEALPIVPGAVQRVVQTFI